MDIPPESGHFNVRPEPSRVDGVGVAFAAVFAVIGCVTCAAMFLTWLGAFNLGTVIAVSIAPAVLAVALILRSRGAKGWALGPTPVRTAVTVAGLTVLSAVLFFKPAEYVFDGSDGSIYTAMAAMLESSGTLHPTDALASRLTDAERAALYPTARWSGRLERFPGGLELDGDPVRIQPEFLHVYPVWMAVAGSAAGSSARFYVNPIAAWLGLIALWLIGRRLAGPLAGELAAVLLAMNIAEVHFARFPSSEMTAQFLILSGLFFTLLATDTRWTPAGICAGLAFGLAAMTRVDALVLLTPPVAIVLIHEFRRAGAERYLVVMAATWGLLTAWSGVYAMTTARSYVSRIAGSINAGAGGHPAIAILLLLAVAMVAIGLFMRMRTRVVRRTVIGAGSMLAGGAMVTLLWFDRSHGHFLEVVTVAGAVLALAGLLAMVWNGDAGRTLPIVLVFAFMMMLMARPPDQAVLPWNLRRYVPVLLPIACLAIGYLVARVQLLRPQLRFVMLAPAALGVVFAAQSWPIFAEPRMRDGREELAKIEEVVDPAALLIWDQGLPSHLPAATHYLLGRESVLMPATEAAEPVVRRLAAEALAAGRRVWIVMDGSRDTVSSSPWRVRLRDVPILFGSSIVIRTDLLRPTDGGLPLRTAASERRLDFYSVGLRTQTTTALPLRIDIGGHDVPYLLGGFHGAEREMNTSYRWTSSEARVFVPQFEATADDDVQVFVRLGAGGRPSTLPVLVNIAWNGISVGEVEVQKEMRDYDVTLERGSLGSRHGGELTLRASTFVPRDAGLGIDRRTLGVRVDAVTIRAMARQR